MLSFMSRFTLAMIKGNQFIKRPYEIFLVGFLFLHDLESDVNKKYGNDICNSVVKSIASCIVNSYTMSTSLNIQETFCP